MLALITVYVAFFFTLVQAVPYAIRDVVNPTITSPNAQTVWQVGQTETVTWRTDNLPPDSQITNPNGKVVLGWEEPDSLNLQLNTPLAQNFKLRDGKVDIVVPSVPPRTNYIIVLFGDSGNASPQFAIQGGPPLNTSTSSVSNNIPITGSVITGGKSSTPPSVTPTSPNADTPSTSTSTTSTTTSSSKSPPASAPTTPSGTAVGANSSPSTSTLSGAASGPLHAQLMNYLLITAITIATLTIS